MATKTETKKPAKKKDTKRRVPDCKVGEFLFNDGDDRRSPTAGREITAIEPDVSVTVVSAKGRVSVIRWDIARRYSVGARKTKTAPKASADA